MVRWVVCVIGLLGVLAVGALTAARADWDSAAAAYDKGDYATAFAEWKRLAEQGDAAAQYMLGLMHAEGRGVARDERQAARSYRAAAEQGLAEAQHELGLRYTRGNGVAADDGFAVIWFRAAAQQGYAPAQRDLAWMYDTGLGVTRDYAEAARWYRAAAEQGDTEAQYQLGLMYKYGAGVTVDLVQAYMWLDLVVQAYPPGWDREAMINRRDSVAEAMTAEQLQQAQELARRWQPKERVP